MTTVLVDGDVSAADLAAAQAHIHSADEASAEVELMPLKPRLNYAELVIGTVSVLVSIASFVHTVVMARREARSKNESSELAAAATAAALVALRSHHPSVEAEVSLVAQEQPDRFHLRYKVDGRGIDVTIQQDGSAVSASVRAEE